MVVGWGILEGIILHLGNENASLLPFSCSPLFVFLFLYFGLSCFGGDCGLLRVGDTDHTGAGLQHCPYPGAPFLFPLLSQMVEEDHSGAQSLVFQDSLAWQLSLRLKDLQPVLAAAPASPGAGSGSCLAFFALWGTALAAPLPPSDSLTFVQRLIGLIRSWKNRLERTCWGG